MCYKGVFSVKFLLDVYCQSNYSEEVVHCGDQECKFYNSFALHIHICSNIKSNSSKYLENKNRLSHYNASHNPYLSVLHRFFGFLYIPLPLISEGSIFSTRFFCVALQSLFHFYSLGRGRGVVLPNITSSFIFRGQQLPKLLLAKRNTSANKNPNSKSRKSVLHTKNPYKLKLYKLFMAI